MRALDDLQDALKNWLDENSDSISDWDDAYEKLNDIFQPILDGSIIPI